jgi:hypothetical protein
VALVGGFACTGLLVAVVVAEDIGITPLNPAVKPYPQKQQARGRVMKGTCNRGLSYSTVVLYVVAIRSYQIHPSFLDRCAVDVLRRRLAGLGYRRDRGRANGAGPCADRDP